MDDIKDIVLRIVAAIPIGRVASYGQVAKKAGYPSHARYVGAVLKNLPDGSCLPWHRVVNAKGQLAFSQGSDAYNKQQKLLENEGVVFKQGRLSMRVYGWHE